MHHMIENNYLKLEGHGRLSQRAPTIKTDERNALLIILSHSP